MLELIEEITSTVGPHGEKYEIDVELKHSSAYVKISHPTLGIISTVRQDGAQPHSMERAMELARHKWHAFQTQTSGPSSFTPSFFRGNS